MCDQRELLRRHGNCNQEEYSDINRDTLATSKRKLPNIGQIFWVSKGPRGLFTWPYVTGLLQIFQKRKGYWLHVNPLRARFTKLGAKLPVLIKKSNSILGVC